MVVVLATARFRAMELITILNRCHHFRGFVYHHSRFTADRNSIEISVRPRQGSAAICSRCHHSAPGYDQLPERRQRYVANIGSVDEDRAFLRIAQALQQG